MTLCVDQILVNGFGKFVLQNHSDAIFIQRNRKCEGKLK